MSTFVCAVFSSLCGGFVRIKGASCSCGVASISYVFNGNSTSFVIYQCIDPDLQHDS